MCIYIGPKVVLGFSKGFCDNLSFMNYFVLSMFGMSNLLRRAGSLTQELSQSHPCYGFVHQSILHPRVHEPAIDRRFCSQRGTEARGEDSESSKASTVTDSETARDLPFRRAAGG